MKAYCVLRIEKKKEQVQFQNMYLHNFRIDKAYNADPAKSHLNTELVALNEGEDYWSAQQKRLWELPAYQQGKRPRKDAVMGYEIVLSRSSSYTPEEFNQEAWEKKNVEWLQETFGKENVLSAVCHRDEGPVEHIHAVVIPVHDGKLNASHYTKTAQHYRELQTSYAQAMEEFGLERGEYGSVESHIPMKDFHKAVNKAASYEISEPNKGESLKDYVARLQQEAREREMHHLSELGKERRKAALAQTELRNARMEIEKERQDMADKMSIIDMQLDEFARIRAQNESIIWRSERFAELSAGIKEGYFQDDKDRSAFVELVKNVSNYGRQHMLNERELLHYPEDNANSSEDR